MTTDTGTSTTSILIVDDDPDICQALTDLLEYEGYQVQVAGTGQGAITKATHERFSAVLLDVMLPDRDGLSVLTALLELHPQLPVIILTAFTTEDSTVGALRRGAFAYLKKPYNRDELKATLRRAVGVTALATKADYIQSALSESEDRFRAVVESAGDAIILADDEGNILSWNPAAQRLFTYTDAEVLGKPLTMIMPERYRARHEQGLKRLKETGQSRLIGTTIELHGLRKNGTEFPLELALSTWKTKSGTFYSGIIRNTTERKRVEAVLDHLRRQQELILASAGEGIYGLDLQGRTIFLNPAGARMLGWEVEQLLGRPMHPILHHSKPDGTPYPVEDCPINAACRDGQVHRMDTDVFWRKDGTSFPVEYVSTPIREHGELAGAVVVFKDITERKRAEVALRESEQRFRSLAESANDAIVVTDEAGHIVLWNKAAQATFGYAAEEVLGKPHTLIMPERYRQDCQKGVERVTTTGESSLVGTTVELPGLTKDGREIPLEISLSTWAIEQKRFYGTILRDITNRKRAEEALRESEARFRQLAENIREVFWMTDPEKNQMLYISPGYEAIWGRTCESLYASPRSWLETIHPEDRNRVLQAALTKQVTGTYDEEYRIVRPDGSIRWIWDRAFPIKDDSGRVHRIVGIAEDITEREVKAR